MQLAFFDETTLSGVFAKYDQIESSGNWFDLENFDSATPEKIKDIAIPKNLRPNHSAFNFLVDPKLHILVFATYMDSRNLSTRAVQKYFETILAYDDIASKFGHVECDLVKSFSEVDRILSLSGIRELHITINRPNNDDIGDDFASIIEERLNEQGADRYEESLSVGLGGEISPNDRTKKLAAVAAENGDVKAKVLVNGVLKTEETSSRPLTEVEKYKTDESNSLTVFRRLAGRIFASVRENRATMS